MRFILTIFLLSLSCVCLTLAQGSYDDCCLKYVKNKQLYIQKHAVKYRRQEPDGGCNISAAIFIMRRGRMFCTDGSEQWVKKLMNEIDKRGKERRKHHRQRANRG
ncbi:C-C motif chemokine 21 [Paralichthys olivaceus]|uniref:C-C motif chemokine 21 n=1 Tax=Paralichthys olivaceus TaxID=8255 RepID=UPI00097D8BD9|nr:PREDICTED: C-C motif chemokine 21-like [Paralichthys olivaceus]